MGVQKDIHFTIYNRPRDYPEEVVVRRWYIEPGKPVPDPIIWNISKTIEDARRSIPPGKHNIGRMPSDDSCIVETWV